MISSGFIGLVNNAALLLALGLLYDMMGYRIWSDKSMFRQLLTGGIVGGIGIAIMMNPWDFGQGVLFDTRSVLLCITGFFFGPVPAVSAMLMTGAFRLVTGGNGAWTGVAVIVTSGGIGLTWRYLRRNHEDNPSMGELYLLGIVAHVAMLGWMLTLPWVVAAGVLAKITLPVMVIYPLATAILGMLMVNRGKQKQSEAELQKSEEKWRAYVRSAPHGVFVVDGKGKFVDINPAAGRITGYAEPELMRMRISDLLPPESLEAVIASFQHLMSEGFYTGENAFIDKSGRKRHCTISAVRLRNDRFLGYVEDITERKQAQEVLQLNERILTASQHLAKIGGWEWNVAARAMNWTNEVYRIHDLDPAEFVPGSPEHVAQSLACYDPADRDRILAAFQRCAEQGEPYDFEMPFTTAKGRRLWIRTTAEAVKTDGRITRVVGNIMDITDRKKAEEQRTESHNLLTNLARLVPGVIYQYRLYPDGSSAFPYASPGMNDIYEVTPEEVREDATPVYGRLHPDDYDQVVAAIQESAQTLEIFYCEFRVLLPRQGLRWRWSQAHPERMHDGSILWHGIILDVTERKKAEEEKDKLNAQLIQAQKIESVGRLAGGVAHDFNNMLMIIIGNTEMAMEETDPSSPVFAQLKEVLASARKSADLTRQLLAFARKQTVSLKLLDLNETVSSMIKMLKRLIGEDIELVWKPFTELWPVKMDPSQIDQILVNLAVNARDAITGVGNLTIETGNIVFDETYCLTHAGMFPGEYVLLAVSDTGSGMEKETLAHLFEPFFTTKELGKGTGLGLATIYGIVKQNEGFINVYSEPGHGTTFKIYLPRTRIDSGAETPETTKKPTGGAETVLMVEDEPSILKLGKAILERYGYTVLAARKPEDALALAERHEGPIHLLITDVVMPQMNGRILQEKIAAFRPEIKTLYMSGYTANVIAHHGVLEDGVHFLQKPFSIQTLAQKVREVLEISNNA
ncbi:MAG: PAS domain S-box protein [Thermodesulfobacteriota bacterium]